MPISEHHHRFFLSLRTHMRTRVIEFSFSLFISFSYRGYGGKFFFFFFRFLSQPFNSVFNVVLKSVFNGRLG